MNDDLRVCFSCPMARPVFEPQSPGPFGGSEVRSWLFANGLAKARCDVHVVVETHERLAPRQVGSVTMHYRRLPAPRKRWRDISGRWQRIAAVPQLVGQRLWRSLEKRWSHHSAWPQHMPELTDVAADVYVAFGVHEHAANVVWSAQSMQRPSVLMLASDTDVSTEYVSNKGDAARRNAYRQRTDVCRFALDQATLIVAQTETQRRALQDRFGRDSTLIRNPIEIASIQSTAVGPAVAASTSADRYDVLWLGRADRFSKRADLIVRLARECPQVRFLIVMNRRDPHVYAELTHDLPTNVDLRPQVARDEVDALLRQSRMLVNTSDAEGFPNTFLQAALAGVPVVSLNVDADGMLSQHGCGVCADGDWDRLTKHVVRLSRAAGEKLIRNANGPRYVQMFHNAGDRCRELLEALRSTDVRTNSMLLSREVA